jgi:hypothetical protein
MARKRYDKAAAAARQAMLDSVNNCGTLPSRRDTPTAAWGAIVGHAAEIAMSQSEARGMADLSRFVGQATGMLMQQHERLDAPPPGFARIDVDLGALRDMLSAIRDERERREARIDDTLIDCKIIDNE